MAPVGVEVWSADSRPTCVRPEAVTVLKEIGIDISQHRSKAIADILAADVDTVITLCAEEECPSCLIAFTLQDSLDVCMICDKGVGICSSILFPQRKGINWDFATAELKSFRYFSRPPLRTVWLILVRHFVEPTLLPETTEQDPAKRQ